MLNAILAFGEKVFRGRDSLSLSTLMDTISSGYANFAYTRKRMGTTSSLLMPKSSRDTIEASPIKREPHYSE